MLIKKNKIGLLFSFASVIRVCSKENIRNQAMLVSYFFFHFKYLHSHLIIYSIGGVCHDSSQGFIFDKF